MSRQTMARRALDRRVRSLQGDPGANPMRGWIRAVREALGMTAEQLGRRLGVSRQAVLSFERSEFDGRIQVSSLRRVAEALDCHLVYAFVPNTSLDDVVQQQARRIAAAELARVDQTMLLEAQRVGDDEAADLLEARVAQLIDDRHLWDRDPVLP